jgi:hypothetical protein
MELTKHMGLPQLEAGTAAALDQYAGNEINRDTQSSILERYLLNSIKAILLLHLGGTLDERSFTILWKRVLPDVGIPDLRNEIVAEYRNPRGGLRHRLNAGFWTRMLDAVQLPPHGLSNHPTVYFLHQVGETHTYELPMFHAFCHRMQTHKLVAMDDVFRLFCSMLLLHKNIEEVLVESHWTSANNVAGICAELANFACNYPPGLVTADDDRPSLPEERRIKMWMRECAILLQMLRLDTCDYTERGHHKH